MLENIFTFDGRMGDEMALLYEAEFADPALYMQEVFPSGERQRSTDQGALEAVGRLRDRRIARAQRVVGDAPRWSDAP